MPSDAPPPSDPLRVRLSWPDDDVRRPTPPAPPAPPTSTWDDDAAEDDDTFEDVPSYEARVAPTPPPPPPARPAAEPEAESGEPTLFVPPRPVTTSEPAPVGYDMGEPPEEGSILFTVASRLEGLRAAMGNMALRLDSMIRREEEFREYTTARLAEYAEQLALAVGQASADVEERTRSQERSLVEMTTNTARLLEDMSQSTAAVNGVTDRLAVLESSTEAAHTMVDELVELVAGLREELAVATNRQMVDVEGLRAEVVASIARTDERSDDLAADIGEIAEELRALRRRITVRTTPAATATAPKGRAAHDEVEEERPARRTPRRRGDR